MVATMATTMNKNKIPTAKLKRTAIAGLTTARLGLKHMTHLGKKSFSRMGENSQDDVRHEKEVGEILINALMQLRGTALKAAQMMSMELDMLPEGVRVELAKACSQVTPLNRAHIRKVFLDEFEQAPERVFRQFDSKAFAAASLGQVHKAAMDDERPLAVKIQYPGIGASIQSDVQLVRGVMKSLSVSTAFLPRYDLINRVLDDVQIQLEKEIDYQLEADNTRWFAQHITLPNIHVPAVYAQFSGAKVLTTEFIAGMHIDQWLNNQPSDAQRNQYGQLLFDLFCYQLHDLKVLHADPHPGNFIFCDDGRIALIDYGCVHRLHENFPTTITRLFTPKSSELYQAYIDLGLIHQSLSYEAFELEFLPVISRIQKWMAAPFQQSEFDFSQMGPMPSTQLSTMKAAAKHVNNMRQDQMVFDRCFFGLLSSLRKLGAKINTAGLLRIH